jgi:hypothetical protein
MLRTGKSLSVTSAVPAGQQPTFVAKPQSIPLAKPQSKPLAKPQPTPVAKSSAIAKPYIAVTHTPVVSLKNIQQEQVRTLLCISMFT